MGVFQIRIFNFQIVPPTRRRPERAPQEGLRRSQAGPRPAAASSATSGQRDL